MALAKKEMSQNAYGDRETEREWDATRLNDKMEQFRVTVFA